jgi:hypothetical protein
MERWRPRGLREMGRTPAQRMLGSVCDPTIGRRKENRLVVESRPANAKALTLDSHSRSVELPPLPDLHSPYTGYRRCLSAAPLASCVSPPALWAGAIVTGSMRVSFLRPKTG